MAHFSYDSLGNLTGNGVAANQVFSMPPYNTQHPHGIKYNSDTDTTYSYDLDGNLRTEVSSSGTQYLNYDSQNRLVCRGTTDWGCEEFQVNYDAEGERARVWANSSNGWEVLYAGEFFQRNVASGVNYINIFAFGEQIAFKKYEGGTLRTASAGWALPLRFEPVPPIAWGLLTAVSIGAGWLLLLRLGCAEAARQEPVGAALCLLLAVALVVPPIPARGGGGGGPSLCGIGPSRITWEAPRSG
jgi:YD repeat-containing protein